SASSSTARSGRFETDFIGRMARCRSDPHVHRRHGMAHNRYWNTAKLYDEDERAIVQDDIPFYLELADRCPGPVLELACGTGRVTLPLLRAGREVWGLDYSPHMLERLSRKLTACSAEERQRMHLLEADMADFRLPTRFSLIFIPFRSFQLLTETARAAACLQRACDHLN